MAGVRSNTPAAYLKDMYKVYFEKKKALKPRYNQIFKVVNGVKGAGDKETQLLGLGALERHLVENQEINYKSPGQGWPFYVKYWTFSDGVSLGFEAVEDNVKVSNFLKKLSRTWTESDIDAKETLCSRVFNEGGALAGDWVFNGSHEGQTDPSGDLMYDSKPLFALSGNEFTKKDGSTYYNSIAGLDLDVTTFEQIFNLHTSTIAYDELGRPVNQEVDTLLTQRGSDFNMAKRILQTTEGYPQSQLNDKNIWQGTASPLDWAYLDDSAFYMGKRQHEDFQFHERQAPRFSYYEDKKTKGSLADVIERFGVMLKGRPWSRGGGTSA